MKQTGTCPRDEPWDRHPLLVLHCHYLGRVPASIDQSPAIASIEFEITALAYAGL